MFSSDDSFPKMPEVHRTTQWLLGEGLSPLNGELGADETSEDDDYTPFREKKGSEPKNTSGPAVRTRTRVSLRDHSLLVEPDYDFETGQPNPASFNPTPFFERRDIDDTYKSFLTNLWGSDLDGPAQESMGPGFAFGAEPTVGSPPRRSPRKHGPRGSPAAAAAATSSSSSARTLLGGASTQDDDDEDDDDDDEWIFPEDGDTSHRATASRRRRRSRAAQLPSAASRDDDDTTGVLSDGASSAIRSGATSLFTDDDATSASGAVTPFDDEERYEPVPADELNDLLREMVEIGANKLSGAPANQLDRATSRRLRLLTRIQQSVDDGRFRPLVAQMLLSPRSTRQSKAATLAAAAAAAKGPPPVPAPSSADNPRRRSLQLSSPSSRSANAKSPITGSGPSRFADPFPDPEGRTDRLKPKKRKTSSPMADSSPVFDPSSQEVHTDEVLVKGHFQMCLQVYLLSLLEVANAPASLRASRLDVANRAWKMIQDLLSKMSLLRQSVAPPPSTQVVRPLLSFACAVDLNSKLLPKITRQTKVSPDLIRSLIYDKESDFSRDLDPTLMVNLSEIGSPYSTESILESIRKKKYFFLDEEENLLAKCLWLKGPSRWIQLATLHLPHFSRKRLDSRVKNRTVAKIARNSLKLAKQAWTDPLTSQEVANLKQGVDEVTGGRVAVTTADWARISSEYVPGRAPELLSRLHAGENKKQRVEAKLKSKRAKIVSSKTSQAKKKDAVGASTSAAAAAAAAAAAPKLKRKIGRPPLARGDQVTQRLHGTPPPPPPKRRKTGTVPFPPLPPAAAAAAAAAAGAAKGKKRATVRFASDVRGGDRVSSSSVSDESSDSYDSSGSGEYDEDSSSAATSSSSSSSSSDESFRLSDEDVGLFDTTRERKTVVTAAGPGMGPLSIAATPAPASGSVPPDWTKEEDKIVLLAAFKNVTGDALSIRPEFLQKRTAAEISARQTFLVQEFNKTAGR